MVALDLTPEELKVSHLRRRRLRIWSVILVVTLVVNGGWILIKYFSYHRESSTVQEITREYETLQQGINSLSQVRSRIDLWQDRLVLLQELDRYGDYVKVTDFLTQNSPPLIYLGELKFWRPEPKSGASPKPSPNQTKAAEMFNIADAKKVDTASPSQKLDEPIMMSLTGHSVDYQSVADYLNLLTAAELIAEPQLIYSRRQFSAAPDLKDIIDFEIEARLFSIPSWPGVQYAHLQKTKDF